MEESSLRYFAVLHEAQCKHSAQSGGKAKGIASRGHPPCRIY